MSEYLHLDLGGEEFEATPENTSLFTFLGQTALNGLMLDNERFNHIFFYKEMTDRGNLSGSYMFRTENNGDTWDAIANYIATNDYPMSLNQREVPDCDVV